ncbi:Sybindin-like protein [Fimicolochytrium jonesii]|uniref:Sybindin-like protein n=1 Tax=Fimicolochytrium jonesii TaxID=1396493 RepID=UPI0022FEB768|nr:Sybindin-like protein [Fimicolochytrium jonesii]KAI8818120.1 Sybindin-like protein [Fimicolochytrium jonesii]
MTIYNLYIFDRHCRCVFFAPWTKTPVSQNPPSSQSQPSVTPSETKPQSMKDTLGATGMSLEEEAKLVYGVVFSLKNLVNRLSAKAGSEGFLSYRTSTYKLHYFETPTGLKFVLNTDPTLDSAAMKETLRTIYAQIYVEYVTRNPLAEALRAQGVEPVQSELFKGHLGRFIRSVPGFE